jgi:hypothetical protein
MLNELVSYMIVKRNLPVSQWLVKSLLQGCSATCHLAISRVQLGFRFILQSRYVPLDSEALGLIF